MLVDLKKISILSPAFVNKGMMTAGNSSSLADGAAAVILMRTTEAEKRSFTPLARINEAFAIVVMAAMHELQIPHEKLNIHGGGCSLGHPIGVAGARIIVTLIPALRRHSLKRGIASLYIGDEEATAIAIGVI